MEIRPKVQAGALAPNQNCMRISPKICKVHLFPILTLICAGVLGTGSRASAQQFAYTANINSHSISLYSVDLFTGVLAPSPTSTVPAGDSPFALAMDPAGR